MARRNYGRLLSMCWLAVAALTIWTASGCKSAPAAPQLPFETGPLKETSLAALKQVIAGNAAMLNTMTAECDVAIQSDILRAPGQTKIELTRGRLVIAKPKKVYLQFTKAGQVAMKLVGDQMNYQVEMPVKGISYSGKYGEPVMPTPGRLHFLPEDLADAFDLNDVFAQKAQVLRGYPAGWDLFPGGLLDARVAPGLWHIDSLEVVEKPEPGLRIVNSILIDRATDRIVRLDKFRPDGTLRTRIWYVNHQMVPSGPGKTNIEVPSEILIWYPSPLERTVIHIRMDHMKVNISVSEKQFTLGG